MEVEVLKKRRSQLKRSVTKIYNFVSGPNATYDEVKVRITELDIIYTNYKHIQDEIDLLCGTEEEITTENKYRDNVEDMFFQAKAIWSSQSQGNLDNTIVDGAHASTPNLINDLSNTVQAIVQQQSTTTAILETVSTTLSTVTSMQTGNNHSELRLPPVQIPDFDGELCNWIRFRDLFKAMVDSKSNLSNIEKLEYLQSKLKGEASSIIKHLSPTNDNYRVAWDLIIENYDRPELIEKQYFDLLFKQASVKNASYTQFKRFYNTTVESYNVLESLNTSVESWDSVLLYHIEEKLDSETMTLWHRQKIDKEAQTFPQLIKFLKHRLLELEETQNSSHVTRQRPKSVALTTTTHAQFCPLCNGSHALYRCQQFRSLNISERRKLVHGCKLCFNCLKEEHFSKDCKSGSCKICNLKHSTLLHVDKTQTQVRRNENTVSVSVNCRQETAKQTTLLPTAIVLVRDINNVFQPCRALIDSGAQSTLISEACVQRLNLTRSYDKTLLYGVGVANPNYTKGKVQMELFAPQTNQTMHINSFCLSNLTQFLPNQTIDNIYLQYFNNLELADPGFARKNRIDIILSADIFARCILEGKCSHPSGSPVALNTIFGWIVMGNVNEQQQSTFIAHVYSDLDYQLQRFWNIEDCQHEEKYWTPEEQLAENHYAQNVQRQKDGRYMVRLPFKSGFNELSESKMAAIKRLETMERKFTRNEELKTEFHKFMKEYETLNHMQPATRNVAKYYMPHHAVVKPSSTTTKLRVVFDASCKSSNNYSLNDHLLVGPTIQNNLFNIILKFRKYEIGFTADIEKMYRQVLVHPADRVFQTILWRTSSTTEPIEYQLTTVTYGTASAPFLAARTLQQVSFDNSIEYQRESAEIMNSFYVDDYMSSAPDVESANSLRTSLCLILSESGFNLRKWASNCQQFQNNINPVDRAVSQDMIIDSSDTIKTLGLLWNTKLDCFQYSVSISESSVVATKRQVLSEISKVYDPIGWLAPITVRLKIFMQKLWLQGIGWDAEITIESNSEWSQLKHSLNHIPNLKIPRWMQFRDGDKVELHGFSDSSELAYAAAIYIRIINPEGTISTSLLTAKTRVAPLKQITLPRLELCAAQLMVKLMLKVQNSLQLGNIPTHGWTDSTVVLAWLADQPRRWKTFIANRTSFIITHMPAAQWHHISSKHNPADLATRGLNSTDLGNNMLWWIGPQILRNDILINNPQPKIPGNCHLEERKKFIATVMSTENNYVELIDRYSSYTKLIRITALLFRFLSNCKSKAFNKEPNCSFLTTTELEKAKRALIKNAQHECFLNEIRILSSGKTLGTKHELAALTPFVDNNVFLRVGGRLGNANIGYEQRHPYILHKDHNLTKLICEHYHQKHLHAGVRQMQYLLGLNYWIPNVIHMLKRTVYKCTVCMRHRQMPYQQRMGDLPAYRVQQGSTFLHVGIDFAGPIFVRSWKGRGSKSYKCWIAVFVCLNTKAIHLEAVTELTSQAFEASLRRFTSRRGKPCHIYTDNGTNFIGWKKNLKELHQFLMNSQDIIYRSLAEQQITWHFIPPSAPNFGGIWEAGVKSVKFHLNRVLGSSSVTYEELSTLLCQIECCLNSRPLCLKFEDDTDPLTPGHFLILRPMTTLPDKNFMNVNVNRLTRWQFMQKLLQQFWSKWSTEYLSQLQKKPKWMTKMQNLQRNDVVLIKDDNLPPSQWLLGKIETTHPGNDGLVRVATVRTQNSLLKRPISKLCPLFIDC